MSSPSSSSRSCWWTRTQASSGQHLSKLLLQRDELRQSRILQFPVPAKPQDWIQSRIQSRTLQLPIPTEPPTTVFDTVPDRIWSRLILQIWIATATASASNSVEVSSSTVEWRPVDLQVGGCLRVTGGCKKLTYQCTWEQSSALQAFWRRSSTLPRKPRQLQSQPSREAASYRWGSQYRLDFICFCLSISESNLPICCPLG